MTDHPVGVRPRPPGQPRDAQPEPADAQLLARFVANHDEAAFALLVQRHGPMVLSVCRRVLRDPHDADDAFQATFLVFVRKAGAIGRPELLANWLYGVAYRVAAKARARAAQRRAHERQVASMPRADSPTHDTGWELRAVLDEELQHLPDKYRTPLVLCYLEGLTNEEAARRLGWPTGSMSSRLARGRDLLRKRLRRRGIFFTALPFAVWLTQNAAAAAVPAVLAQTTVKSALLVASGQVGAGTISSSVAALTEETLEVLAAGSRWPAAQVLLLILLLFVGAGTVACTVLAGERQGLLRWPGCNRP